MSFIFISIHKMWIPAPQSSHKSLSSPDQDLQLSRCPTRKQLDAGWSNSRFTSPKILPPSLVSSISLASDQNKTFEQGKLVDLAGQCSPACGRPPLRFSSSSSSPSSEVAHCCAILFVSCDRRSLIVIVC